MKIHIKIPYQPEVDMDIAEINAGLEDGKIPEERSGFFFQRGNERFLQAVEPEADIEERHG